MAEVVPREMTDSQVRKIANDPRIGGYETDTATAIWLARRLRSMGYRSSTSRVRASNMRLVTWSRPNPRRTTAKPANRFDPRSLRTVKAGRNRVTIGCPKGRYDARKKRCRVGTQAQAVIHPNPPRGRGRPMLLYPNAVLRGTLYGRHANGRHYYHRFGTHHVKRVLGLPNGNLLLESRKGPLWRCQQCRRPHGA